MKLSQIESRLRRLRHEKQPTDRQKARIKQLERMIVAMPEVDKLNYAYTGKVTFL